MKQELKWCLMWALVFGAILVGAIVSIFWKPATYGVASFAGIFFLDWIVEIIRYARMK